MTPRRRNTVRSTRRRTALPNRSTTLSAIFGPGGIVKEPSDSTAEKLAPGPKATRAAAHTPPPEHSGGTSGELSIPGYEPETPTGAPYSPSEPGHSKRDFARAFREQKRAPVEGKGVVSSVLQALDTLTTPLGTRSPEQTAQAAANLGLKPSEVESPETQKAVTNDLARKFGQGVAKIVAGAKAPKSATPSPQELLKQLPSFDAPKAPSQPRTQESGRDKAQEEVGQIITNARKQAAKATSVSDMGAALAKASHGLYVPDFYNNGTPKNARGKRELAAFRNPGGRTGKVKPNFADKEDPLGKKTLGNASTAELARAAKEGKLKVSKRGIISTPQNRKTRAQLVAAQKAASAARTLGKAKQHGQLTPQEIGTLLVQEGRKLGANLTPAEIAEGIGVAEAESAGNADEQRQLASFSNPEDAHIGLFAEEGNGFNLNPEQRLNARLATKGAIERFVADGRSWNPAWVHWQEVQGENETGADRAPQYRALAQELDQGSSQAPRALRQNLKEAEAEAKKAGIDPKVVTGQKHHANLGPIEPQVLSRFQAILKSAKQLNKFELPYLWGGGHGSFSSPSGYDCSGAVSYALHSIGLLDAPVTSGETGNVKGLAPGPGAVTIYWNGEHTFMKIGKHYFGTSNDNPGGGAGFFSEQTGNSEVEGGNAAGAFNVSHVQGLGKKVALQLGLKPSELTGAGMTYSSDGSTATINAGAGTEVAGGAKYSNSPIAPEGSAEAGAAGAGVSSGGIALSGLLSGSPLTSPAGEGGERALIEELIAAHPQAKRRL